MNEYDRERAYEGWPSVALCSIHFSDPGREAHHVFAHASRITSCAAAGHGPGVRARIHLNQSGRRFNGGSRNIPTPLPKICLRVCGKTCPAFSLQGNRELSNAESNSGVVKSHASCRSVLTLRQKWTGMCASLMPPSTPTRSAYDQPAGFQIDQTRREKLTGIASLSGHTRYHGKDGSLWLLRGTGTGFAAD